MFGNCLFDPAFDEPGQIFKIDAFKLDIALSDVGDQHPVCIDLDAPVHLLGCDPWKPVRVSLRGIEDALLYFLCALLGRERSRADDEEIRFTVNDDRSGNGLDLLLRFRVRRFGLRLSGHDQENGREQSAE